MGASASAHDPSAYGGLFRSRDLGGVWLNADVGLFLNAALTVAVDPRDPNDVLIGQRSRPDALAQRGPQLEPEAPDLVTGAVFALAFSPDGAGALCAAPSGVFRLSDGRWSGCAAPDGAAPARAIGFGAAPGRVYCSAGAACSRAGTAGRAYGRWRSARPSEEAEMHARSPWRRGRARPCSRWSRRQPWSSDDGGQRWSPRAAGMGTACRWTRWWSTPCRAGRLWAAQGDRRLSSATIRA